MGQIAASDLRIPLAGPDGPASGEHWRDLLVRLLGFCVQCHLDIGPDSRATWAAHLNKSRSHLTEMARRPNRVFLVGFDSRLSEMDCEQALSPRLTQLHDDMFPTLPGDSASDWMAGYYDLLGRTDHMSVILGDLLRAEVVMARCRVPRMNDALEYDPTVHATIANLLSVASAPLGGSAAASQRCAELGIHLPTAFLAGIDAHLRTSPVGFRGLRSLARFTQLWRAHRATGLVPATRVAEVDQALASLLTGLAQPVYRDPYPGAEWSIVVARERLLTVWPNKTALSWLRTAAHNESWSPRARLFATWARLHRSKRGSALRGSRLTDAAIRDSGYSSLASWADLFEAAGTPDFTAAEISEEALTSFEPFMSDVRRAVRSLDRKLVPNSIEHTTGDLIAAIVLTPDGQFRRHLIEAAIAAGLVQASIKVLLAIYPRDGDPAIREAILFALCRFREPSERVIDLMLEESLSDDPFVRATALWGLGDVARQQMDPSSAERMVSQLMKVASSNAEPIEIRETATHSLAVATVQLGTADESLRAIAEETPELAMLAQWGVDSARALRQS